MAAKTLTELVAIGVRLLDDIDPAWHTHVWIEGLRMDESHSCVLGQWKGYYSRGLQKIQEHDQYQKYDPDLNDEMLESIFNDAEYTYRGLNTAWKKALRAKKGIPYRSS